MLPAAARAGVKKLCFGSSASVYGDNHTVPELENILSEPKRPYAAAVPIFIDKAIRNEPITLFGDGLQAREFIYVKDVVAANVFLAERPELTGVYNVACGRSITIQDLAEKIVMLTGSKSTIQYAPLRAGDVKHPRASVDKINKTGYQAVIIFEEGVQRAIRICSQINHEKQVIIKGLALNLLIFQTTGRINHRCDNYI